MNEKVNDKNKKSKETGKETNSETFTEERRMKIKSVLKAVLDKVKGRQNGGKDRHRKLSSIVVPKSETNNKKTEKLKILKEALDRNHSSKESTKEKSSGKHIKKLIIQKILLGALSNNGETDTK